MDNSPKIICFTFLLLLIAVINPLIAVNVKIVKNSQNNWQLIKDEEPFYIKGAGGSDNLELLVESGGNCLRTWGIDDNFGDLLDYAHSLGLCVVAGLWLGQPRHGFDYSDPVALSKQKEKIKNDVLMYKNHPAILIWGIGNEMEGIEEGDDINVWKHVQDIAAMIKELDPDHPTMTVTAEIGGKRVEYVHEFCPDIDIMGINSYGGLPSIPQRYREAGGTKPYLITEFGPPGTWESAETSFGTPLELNSTDKADYYRYAYINGCQEEQELCLGSMAFHWGSKLEGTATWYGMFLPTGEKLAAVDIMTELWSNNKPDNFCPAIESFNLVGSDVVESGDEVVINIDLSDPENDKLEVKWSVFEESPEYLIGEMSQWTPLELDKIIQKNSDSQAILKFINSGIYRIFLIVKDGSGGSATANVPIKVNGEKKHPYYKMPVAVYSDHYPMPWFPSGWMGNYDDLNVIYDHKINPYSGENCIKVKYRAPGEWTGVAWQHPSNDWGELEGGYDLTGAKKLTFMAKGEFGIENVSFGIGLLDNDRAFSDTAFEKIEDVKLKQKWKRYTIDLKGKNLSRVKTPFYFIFSGPQQSVTFYLDDIYFE